MRKHSLSMQERKEWFCDTCDHMQNDGSCEVGEEPRITRSPLNLFRKRLKCDSWKIYDGPAIEIVFGEDGEPPTFVPAESVKKEVYDIVSSGRFANAMEMLEDE